MSTNLHMNSGPSGSFPKDQQLNACLSPLDLHTHYFEWKVGCQMTVVVVACSYIYTRALCFWINGWECNEPPIEQAPQKLEVIWKRALRFGLKHSCGKEKGARKGNTVKSVWLRINASQGIWSSQSQSKRKKVFFLPSDKLGVCSDKKNRSFLKLLLFAVLFSLFFWSQKAILWSHFQQNKWIKMK